MDLSKQYNKLRARLFELRMEQTLLSKTTNNEEFLELEQKILKTKQEIANIIKISKSEEVKKGGR